MVAFGGNALQRVGERGSAEEMRANLREALTAIEPLVRHGARLCITHGNGPQVGSALLRSEAGVAQGVAPHPLDVAVATTQGEIGTLLCAELTSLLAEWQLAREVTAVVTHVLVHADDPALRQPTKPIGPFYEQPQAQELQATRGWSVVEDAGRGWRRVVGSPLPQQVLELESIRALLDEGTVVVAAGGGGIPVARSDDGRLEGVEAVIDKDRTAALLAEELGASQLVILTAVDCVYSDFGGPAETALHTLSVQQAQELLDQGVLPSGSMAPKVEAAAAFAQRTGKAALITSESALAAALDKADGTWVQPG